MTPSVSFVTEGIVIFTTISLTAQRNGGKTAKETPSNPCCRSRVNCPLSKGDKMHHRKIVLLNPDRHRSSRRRFSVWIFRSGILRADDIRPYGKNKRAHLRKADALFLNQS